MTDANESRTFWYAEDWADRKALDQRLQSEQFAQVLALMETSATAPLLEIRTVEGRQGLEYVAAIRRVPPDDVPPR